MMERLEFCEGPAIETFRRAVRVHDCAGVDVHHDHGVAYGIENKPLRSYGRFLWFHPTCRPRRYAKTFRPIIENLTAIPDVFNFQAAFN